MLDTGLMNVLATFRVNFKPFFMAKCNFLVWGHLILDLDLVKWTYATGSQLIIDALQQTPKSSKNPRYNSDV